MSSSGLSPSFLGLFYYLLFGPMRTRASSQKCPTPSFFGCETQKMIMRERGSFGHDLRVVFGTKRLDSGKGVVVVEKAKRDLLIMKFISFHQKNKNKNKKNDYQKTKQKINAKKKPTFSPNELAK